MRIRTIKPEFYTHEKLFEAEREFSLPIRLAFTGLWCAADREGRFKWEPRRLGVSILPYDQIDFSRVLDALTTRGFIRKYRVDGVDYGVIESFTRHQVINNRESPSSIPPMVEWEQLVTRGARVVDACPTPLDLALVEGKGREGNKEGKDIESPAPPKTRARDPLFDALAEATDGKAETLTSPTARACGVALANIKRVSPDLTPDEIKRRAANYRSHFRDATLTASALAKHWSRCEEECDQPQSTKGRASFA